MKISGKISGPKKKSKRATGSQFQYKCLQLCKKFYPEGSFHNFTSQAICVKGKWIVKSHDLFSCIDILVMRPEDKPLAIQCTKHTGVTKKLEKMEQVKWIFDHWEVQLWLGKDDGTIDIKKLYWEKEPDDIRGYFELRPYAIIRRGKLYKEEK